VPRKRYPKISEGADGLWHAWVTVGTKPNGRPDQRHIKRATPDEVEERVDELLAQRQTGKVQKAGRAPSVQQMIETYLDTTAPLKIDLSTIDVYRSKMRNHVYPVIGKLPAHRLKPDNLEEVYLEMKRAGLADSTVKQVHRILSRILKIAHRRGTVPANVAGLIDAPTAKDVEIIPPTEEEAARLLAAAERRRNKVRWKLGLGLGLRQGEALGLRWPYVDVDGDEPQANIWWQLSRRQFKHGCGSPPTCGRRKAGYCPQRNLPLKSGEHQVLGGLILKEPKGKSKGEVPLPPELVDELRAHREVQDLEKLMAGDAYVDRGFVFAGLLGEPISPEADWREWQELEQEAGVAGRFRPHDGRHFAATFLLALGVDVRVVQAILRHSSVKVTERYTHVASRMARDAAEKMGRALPKPSAVIDWNDPRRDDTA
jgi:integrase